MSETKAEKEARTIGFRVRDNDGDYWFGPQNYDYQARAPGVVSRDAAKKIYDAARARITRPSCKIRIVRVLRAPSARLAAVEAERDRWISKFDTAYADVEKYMAKRDAAEARATSAESSFLRCAEAIGIVHEGDGFASKPGPVGAVIEAIREARSDRDAQRERAERAETRASRAESAATPAAPTSFQNGNTSPAGPCAEDAPAVSDEELARAYTTAAWDVVTTERSPRHEDALAAARGIRAVVDALAKGGAR